MVAIDTNVLLRHLLSDDPEQAQRARACLKASAPVLITDIVLCETLWTLAGKRYRLSREQLARVVLALLEEPCFCFEDEQAIWAAYCDFVDQTGFGLPDALIAHKARSMGAQPLYSFDRAALRIAGVEAP
ncbi:PIN domain nuclease [Halovibrio salipaludis]|uniref:Ribonuclease VapC n=2 Tax=Halovibrio salipaludis TaxID=2032626 RepID=A0A2A2F6A2_9GAMM|nr:PIN domain nuclease [Halovibrio salipaludis]